MPLPSDPDKNSQKHFDALDESVRRGISAPQVVAENQRAELAANTLPGRIEILDAAEAELQKKKSVLDAERARLASVAGQWRVEISIYDELEKRVENLQSEMSGERAYVAEQRALLLEYAGVSEGAVRDRAGVHTRNIVAAQAAYPLFEDALAALNGQCAAQLGKIADYAKAHSVPAEHWPPALRR